MSDALPGTSRSGVENQSWIVRRDFGGRYYPACMAHRAGPDAPVAADSSKGSSPDSSPNGTRNSRHFCSIFTGKENCARKVSDNYAAY